MNLEAWIMDGDFKIDILIIHPLKRVTVKEWNNSHLLYVPVTVIIGSYWGRYPQSSVLLSSSAYVHSWSDLFQSYGFQCHLCMDSPHICVSTQAFLPNSRLRHPVVCFIPFGCLTDNFKLNFWSSSLVPPDLFWCFPHHSLWHLYFSNHSGQKLWGFSHK